MKAKSTILIIFVTCFLTSNILAQNPVFEWATQMGGISTDFGVSINIDDFGNVYTSGRFREVVDFDPGTGITNLTAAGLYFSDIYIQKLDVNGNFLWAKRIGGNNIEYGGESTIDTNGNVYITGSFYETVDFDPGEGIVNLTSLGLQDIFILKLDVDGNFIWVKQIGGLEVDSGHSITIDVNGNIITTGRFYETVDFDPGEGIVNLTSLGLQDIFILKLDVDGNFIWVKQMGGTNNDWGESITTDINGNIFTTGHFQYTADFDPGAGITNLISVGLNDIFIQKLDATGNLQWVKQMGGTDNDAGISIITDNNGNVFTTGSFSYMVDFDPGTETTYLTSLGGPDIFIQKLDMNGNFLWVNQIGGASEELVASIVTDINGDVYTTGSFWNTVDFDPGEGITNLTSLGINDVFIQKLNTNGNLLWVEQIGGAYTDSGLSINTDTNENVYVTGKFSATVDFDPGEGVFSYTGLGFGDIFNLKLKQTQLGLIENTTNNNFIIYPNPTKYLLHIESSNTINSIKVFDVLGKLVFHENNQVNPLDVSSLDNGLFFIKIETDQGVSTQKVLKQ